MEGVENMEFKIRGEITVTMKKEDIEKTIIECLQSKGYEVIKVDFNVKYDHIYYKHVFDGVEIKVKRKEN